MRSKEFGKMMTYSLLIVFSILLVGVGYTVHKTSQPDGVEEILTAKVEEELVTLSSTTVPWQTIYPEVTSMQIGSTTVQASVAQTWPDRIKGLSDTPYLPDDVVKFFVFDSNGYHSIWMKDMNYSIDIIWLDESGRIVHLVEGAAPESYPAMFTPSEKALYVVEAVDGFIKKHQITKESSVTLPKL